MKFSNFSSDAKRTHYRHANLFEEGTYVQYGDKVGKVHRRGPNYVIAVTDDGNMFRVGWSRLLYTPEDIKIVENFMRNKGGCDG